MNYPLISEYVEAIKAAEDNFDQLKHLRPVLDDDDMPVMSGGNFAVVFKMKDEQTGKLHAVKCFLKEQEGRAEAYRQIAEELEFVSSTFLTPIKYLDKELFVDSANSEDSEFPVLLMDWVEGQTLDKYIREHIDDQYELSLLAYQFGRLAMWLMPQPFAHGDLGDVADAPALCPWRSETRQYPREGRWHAGIGGLRWHVCASHERPEGKRIRQPRLSSPRQNGRSLR